MMTQEILLLDFVPPERGDKLRALLPPGFVLTQATARGDDHLKAVIADADYAISGQVGVSGDVLRAAKKLKLLHKWGVGTDNIDIETARALGIKVARTTGGNALPVAEFTLGLMLSVLRNIARRHAELKKGHWRGLAPAGRAFHLSGKTVGIIGFGAIGKTLAKLLQGFGCEILYAKRQRLSADEEAAFGVSHALLPELLAQSDVVSLHCPLTAETKDMIGAVALAVMKPTAILINVARGGVVVEADLAQALRSGTIAGAAMDVFSTEPLPADSDLLTLDNLVVTPHLAGISEDSFAPTVRRMFANIVLVSRGEPVPPLDSVV